MVARLVAAALIFSGTLGAQTLQPPAPPDYGQWEVLVAQARTGLSPDGTWIAYAINRSNRNNELRLTRIADGKTTTIPFGTLPAFSADTRWAAYAIGISESEEEKLRKDKKPIHRKLGLLNLQSGETTMVDGIESFAFDASGSQIAMRRYPPEKKDAPADAAAGDEDPPAAGTVIVRDLATGRDTTFGNVSDYAWQDVTPPAKRPALLALAISAEEKIGNGIQLYDPRSSTIKVLDSSGSFYGGLSWRKDSADLVALRAKRDDTREGATQDVLAWTSLDADAPRSRTFDPTAVAGLGTSSRTVPFRRPAWSHDGQTVFVGVARWQEKVAEKKDAEKKDAGDAKNAKESTQSDGEEPATVDVWHARDVEVMPWQKVNARAERQRNMLAAWHVDTGNFVRLGTDVYETVFPIKRQKLAYSLNWTPYAMERSIGRGAVDLYLIDLATGERTKVRERIEPRVQVSPGGRYLLFLHAEHYWTIDTQTRAVTNITRNVATSFVDRESDTTAPQKPPFGVAGWTKEDAAVILNDKFDLWEIAPDGSRAVRLTDGTAEQVRQRYVRLDPDEEWIDRAAPIHVSLFSLWTKRSGIGRISPGARGAERVVWHDRMVDRLGKARDAEVYAYVMQSFDDSPDIFAGPTLTDAKQVTATNTFQSKYAWGRATLVEYKSDRGERLQGALYYPAGYEPGKKYPMVVYLYERLSDQLHRYVSPSERDPYNASVFTSQGYFFFMPDIVFRPREPGVSVVECVVPAIRKVASLGVIDPARVGVVGHSWGGFDASYLATHTDVFAAAVAGAPITNLVSNYGNHHWSSGIAETDHIETGQQRMKVPLWEDLPAYIRNSAVFNVHAMKTPLLLMFGENDGTVHWFQGVELYNVARRARKDVVMLAYAGEDHGLRKKPNQLDYHWRIIQWFGHYLKNEPAAPWITSGVRHLDREQELKKLKGKKTT